VTVQQHKSASLKLKAGGPKRHVMQHATMWSCPACRHSNPQRLDVCRTCGTIRDCTRVVYISERGARRMVDESEMSYDCY